MKPERRELPEFVRVERGRRVALVHPDFIPQVSNALLDGAGAWSSDLAGRVDLLQVSTPTGDVLIREYLRGGMVARFLRDAYVLDNRPRRELEAHSHAWRSGVPTVMPVGAMWINLGLAYRGAYATLRADAVDLLNYLQSHSDPDPALLASCGNAICAMHRAGLYHADLQLKNILVGGREGFIIDFDNARVATVTPHMAARNLARLRRSFVKRGLALNTFDAIAEAYHKSSDQHRDAEVTEKQR